MKITSMITYQTAEVLHCQGLMRLQQNQHPEYEYSQGEGVPQTPRTTVTLSACCRHHNLQNIMHSFSSASNVSNTTPFDLQLGKFTIAAILFETRDVKLDSL